MQCVMCIFCMKYTLYIDSNLIKHLMKNYQKITKKTTPRSRIYIPKKCTPKNKLLKAFSIDFFIK